MSAPTPKFSVGDKVTVDPASGAQASVLGRVFTVTKINPKNVACSADDGGKGINFPAFALIPYEGQPVAAPPVLGVPYVRAEIPPALGTIVTLKRPFKNITVDTPLVVVNSRGDKVNVTLLGGDEDRYVRTTPAGVVVRDVAWLTEQLAKDAR